MQWSWDRARNWADFSALVKELLVRSTDIFSEIFVRPLLAQHVWDDPEFHSPMFPVDGESLPFGDTAYNL